MAFLSSLDIGGSALSVQRLRMDVISQNVAKQETYNEAVGEDPYRRQMVVVSEDKEFRSVLKSYSEFEGPKYDKGVYYLNREQKYVNSGVDAVQIVDDPSDFVPVYDPENPLADEDGYIYKTNVDNTKEQIDLLAAQRSYEANASAIAAVKAMYTKAMSLNGR